MELDLKSATFHCPCGYSITGLEVMIANLDMKCPKCKEVRLEDFKVKENGN